MELNAATLAWLTPLVIVVAQVVKGAVGERLTRFVPLVAVAVGIVVAVLAAVAVGDGPVGARLAAACLHGLVGGLSACGLYDAGKPAVDALRRSKAA